MVEICEFAVLIIMFGGFLVLSYYYCRFSVLSVVFFCVFFFGFALLFFQVLPS